ncbi:MAG: hypothetical protein NC416_18800, partial [Eubacterium sp.]|nr:hypothetical protein [Eubacterium sp.]
MKKGFLDRLHNDTDRMWKGGMGLLLILLLLCMGVMQMAGRTGGLSDGTRLCTGLLIVYGAISMVLFGGLYFMTTRQVNDTLYRLGDLIESLTEKEPATVFHVGEDTILSRLQTQLMRLYDILHSYEERERKMSRQLDENI